MSSEESAYLKKKLHQAMVITIALYLVAQVLGYGQCALSVSLAVVASGMLLIVGK